MLSVLSTSRYLHTVWISPPDSLHAKCGRLLSLPILLQSWLCIFLQSISPLRDAHARRDDNKDNCNYNGSVCVRTGKTIRRVSSHSFNLLSKNQWILIDFQLFIILKSECGPQCILFSMLLSNINVKILHAYSRLYH